MVHAPDPSKILYQRDIKQLEEHGILNHEIDSDSWQLIKRHKSFGGIKWYYHVITSYSIHYTKLYDWLSMEYKKNSIILKNR